MNWNFWILKEHKSFTLWKFRPDIPTSFGEIVFEKPKKLQRMYELNNVIFQFLMLFFSLLLIAKSWNLHNLHKLTSSLIFEPSWYINDVTMNPPISYYEVAWETGSKFVP